MALSANTLRDYDLGEINTFGVKATSQIWEGSAVGSSGGYARALVAGDEFLGFALHAQLGLGSDGLNSVQVRSSGKCQLAVTLVAVTDIGKPVYATDDGTFVLSEGDGNSYIGTVHRFISSGQAIVAFDAATAQNAAHRAYSVVSIPITLANITGAGDVVTTWTPGFAGRIEALNFVVTTAVTTAAKLATLNAEIGTTNVTGGLVALTSANCTPLGAVVAGTAVTAANSFGAADTVSIEAASVTAFSEGAGVLLITVSSPV